MIKAMANDSDITVEEYLITNGERKKKSTKYNLISNAFCGKIW